MPSTDSTPIRFNRKDLLFILVCLLVMIGTAWFAATNFHKAFPEASIEFKYNRSQAGDIADSFLEAMDLVPPEPYRHVSRFGMDGLAKTSLEKELGLGNAQKLFGDPVRLWYWQHRWFKPSTKEEFKVYVTPAGEIASFTHLIEDEQEGASLTREEALVMATTFLTETMGISTAELELKESTELGRPNRIDWTFVYTKPGFEPFDGADYRYRVVIQGDQIGEYSEKLHVPETWTAQYRRMRSFNDLGGSIASVLTIATLIALIVIIVLKLRKHDIRWKTALVFGIILSVLVIANELNDLPVSLYGYNTTASWSGFLVQTVLFLVIQGLGAGAFIFILTAGAETMFREQHPNLPALPRIFTVRGLRTKSAFKNILLGITLTPFFLSYQIIFYLISNHFGAWSPADVPYSNLLNTAMPWLAVLMIGFLPATSEEFLSRMFSIPFLEKVMRGRARWLAVLIPAFIWGFGHAGYAAQPWYIRGVEVGIGGIIIGIVMLRFGILAPLVWHYTVDALYTALLLFRSENTYFIVTASVATGLLVLPLLAALVAYIRKGGFLAEEGTLNRDETAENTPFTPPIQPAPATEPTREVDNSLLKTLTPLSGVRKGIAIAILILAIGLMLVPMDRIGSFQEYSVPGRLAITMTKAELAERGWADPDTLKFAVINAQQIRGNSQNEYLLKHTGSIAEFNALVDTVIRESRYAVVAFKPENRLRFISQVDSRTGEVMSLSVRAPEEMPGDSISIDSAEALVIAKLEEYGEDLNEMEKRVHSENVRPNRFDQFIAFETKEDDPRNIGEARYRRGGELIGSWLNVSDYSYFEIPEKWERERTATTAARAILQGAVIIAWIIIIGWAIGVLVTRTRKGLVHWKQAFRLAIIPTGIVLLNGINTYQQYMSQYWQLPETPWMIAKALGFITILIQTGGLYLVLSMSFALMISLYQSKLPLLTRPARRFQAVDAWLAVGAGFGVMILLRVLAGWLAVLNQAWAPFGSWNLPTSLFVPQPFLFMISKLLTFGILSSTLLGFLAWLWQHLDKSWKRGLLLLCLLCAMLNTGACTAGEFLWSLLIALATVGSGWLVVRFIVAGKPAVFLALILSLAVYRIVIPSLVMGNFSLTIVSIAVLATVVVSLFVWLGWPAKTSA